MMVTKAFLSGTISGDYIYSHHMSVGSASERESLMLCAFAGVLSLSGLADCDFEDWCEDFDAFEFRTELLDLRSSRVPA